VVPGTSAIPRDVLEASSTTWETTWEMQLNLKHQLVDRPNPTQWLEFLELVPVIQACSLGGYKARYSSYYFVPAGLDISSIASISAIMLSIAKIAWTVSSLVALTYGQTFQRLGACPSKLSI
jgi:hypothetical protein